MTVKVDRFKHFTIDATGQERLIEMWKYFNPKDEPVPTSEFTIRVNNEYPKVSNHTFMEVLKYFVFDESYKKIDRWQVRSQNILAAHPVEMMYERFIEVKSATSEYRPKKIKVEEEDDEEEQTESKPARRRKK